MMRSTHRWFGVCFFGILLVVGLTLHDDFGVSWDEPISRTNGLVNLKYLSDTLGFAPLSAEVDSAPLLANYQDRDYGVAWEIPALLLEILFDKHDNDVSEIYQFRHLLTFLFSLLGVWAVYAIAVQRFRNHWFGLAAAAFLILSPRIFAESFYNSKDVVFMAAFALAMLTMLKFLRNPTAKFALLHGFATAFTIDVRVMGVLLVAATVCALAINLVKGWYRVAPTLSFVLIYLAATIGFTIAMFPFLWPKPWTNFTMVFENMSHFRWDFAVLYQGQTQAATDLPWHYSLVWIAITTPIGVLSLFLIGVFFVIRAFVRNHIRLWSTQDQMTDVIFLGIIAVPLVSVIVLNSVIYDGWRQLYFVYPAMVLLSVKGLFDLFRILPKTKAVRFGIFGSVLIGLASMVAFIWKAHPHSNVYFNALAPQPWSHYYETDYWGLSAKAALKYIATNDDRPLISIQPVSAVNLQTALLGVDKSTRERFAVTNSQMPMYYINTFRDLRRPEHPRAGKRPIGFDQYSIEHVISVAGQPILEVYKYMHDSKVIRLTRNRDPYTPETLKNLSLSFLGFENNQGDRLARFSLTNTSPTTIAALSSVNSDLAVSWRFTNSAAGLSPPWTNRLSFPYDLEPGDNFEFLIDIGAAPDDSDTLELSFVQEWYYWAHDIGVEPLSVPISEAQ